jgi:hypothetical protein
MHRAAGWYQRALLTLLLLATAATAFAQTTIYGLGVATYDVVNPLTGVQLYPAGTPLLIPISPTTGAPTDPATGTAYGITYVPSNITGITAGQRLVGIDYRPSNRLLYGLGYDTSTGATQLYTIVPGASGVASVATPVNATPLTLPLGNAGAGNSSIRIGFDFNPVADAIRVVSTNGSNYRLNPNTGGLAGTDTNLNYANAVGTPVATPVAIVTGSPTPTIPATPRVGAVAYTNSTAGATATTLFDYDELSGGIISIQNPPNNGTLTQPTRSTFFIQGSPQPGPYGEAATIVAIDIDVYYNNTTLQNSAYLLEITDDRPSGYNASNLYSLDINPASSTFGLSTRIGNIIPSTANPFSAGVPLVPIDVYDIAVAIGTPPNSLVWTGFVSDEWTNPQNWLPNRVPTSTDDVLIPGTYTPGNPPAFPGTTPTPNQPVVRVNGQVAKSIVMNTVGSLTLATNGTLAVGTTFTNTGGTLISSGGALTVGGNFTATNGTYTSSSGTVTVSGNFINTNSTIASTGGTLVVGGNLTNTGGTITGNGGTFTVGGSFVNANAASTLTLNSGSTFNLGGNFTNTGGTVGGSGTGRLALTGALTQTIGGTLSTFPNLTVGTAAANTTGPVTILSTGGVTLNGSLAIGNGQAFTLLSDANGTAFVVNNGAAVATGTATVQRYITSTLNTGAGYHHYSTPVSGNTVADFTTANFTPTVNPAYNSSPTPPTTVPFPTVYTYDQSRLGLNNTSPEFDKGFASPAALSDPLIPTSGYALNIPGTELVDFVGTLNSGSISRVNLTRGPQASAGYHLLGNPYPAPINYTTVAAASTGLEGALYVYQSTGQYVGQYRSYINGIGNPVLPVAQGFFVRVASGQTGTVNFTNAARLTAPDNTPFQRPAADPRPRLVLTLHNATVANQAYIYFEQGATAGFDAGFDAHYLPATHGLDLAAELSTGALSINGLPALASTTTVPLRLHAPVAGAYTLAVDELANLPAGYHAYLRDAFTGTATDLTTTPSVSLTLAPADAPTGRYTIVFGTAAPLAAASAAAAQLVSLYPNPAHGTVQLLLPQALRLGAATPVALVDNLGRTVLARTLSATADALELPLGGLAPGIYSVQASTSAGVVAKRLVVE